MQTRLHALAWISCALSAACGGRGGTLPPPKVSGEIIYSKFRDPSTGQLEPVLKESGTGFDAAEVDSPAMVHDDARPSGKFMLYYEASDSSGSSSIGLVTSDEEDLRPLVLGRTQVVGPGPTPGPYSFGATDPTVVVDTRAASQPVRYNMWFEGLSGSLGEVSTIVFCTSTDGVTWTGFTACTGLSASFAGVRVADPHVLLDGDTYKMWFEAVTSVGGGSSIGYAESANGTAWTVKDFTTSGAGAGPVLTPSGVAGFDAVSVGAPCVVLDPAFAPNTVGRFKMWYEAGDSLTDMQSTIGYATSADGLVWKRATLPVLAASSDATVPLPFDSGDLEHPTALLVSGVPVSTEGHFLLWYTGDGENNASPNRIGLAKGHQ